MQVPLKGGLDGNFVNGGLNAIVNSNNDKIRFFTVQQNASFSSHYRMFLENGKMQVHQLLAPLAQLLIFLQSKLNIY